MARCDSKDALLALLLLATNMFAPIEGFPGTNCLKASSNPSDRLTIPTCDMEGLFLSWNIKQSVHRIIPEFTCMNPSEFNPRPTNFYTYLNSVGRATYMGVAASPGVTCVFSACYQRDPDSTVYFTVSRTSCVVQSPNTLSISITPTATTMEESFTATPTTTTKKEYFTATSPTLEQNAISTILLAPSLDISYSSTQSSQYISSGLVSPNSLLILYINVSHTPSYQIQPSLQSQYTSGTQGSHLLLLSSSPSAVVTLSPVPPYADATMLYVASTVLYTPNALFESCHTSLWCNPNYLAVSTVAAICLVLILLSVVVVCKLRIQKRKVSNRIHELQSLGYKINEKLDPDFKPTLTSHHIFLSVESQLDSLHQPSPVIEETDCSQSYSDGYWSESIFDEYAHQTSISTTTCTFSE